MRIHRVEVSDDRVRVETTGVIVLFLSDGSWSSQSRTDGRELTTGRVTPASSWSVADEADDGVTIRSGAQDVRIGADSLLQFRQRTTDGDVTIAPAFRPAIQTHRRRGAFVADDAGGFGAWPVERCAIARVKDGSSLALAPGGVAWISLFPPRPARREHLDLTIAHEGRPSPFPAGTMPPVEALGSLAGHANVLALHAYFWHEEDPSRRPTFSRYRFRRCPWRSARHVPREPERLADFMTRCREHGLRVVLYVSPRYSAAPDIVAEMTRIVATHEPDGLYLDGIGGGAQSVRDTVIAARRLLGPDRLLYLNATDEPFGAALPCPSIDAWADVVLRGDSGRGGLRRGEFLRWSVSGWNTSNAIGVWCHYGSWGGPFPLDRVPRERDVRDALRHHARLWRRSFWRPTDRLSSFDEVYRRELDALVARESAALDAAPSTATSSAGP